MRAMRILIGGMSRQRSNLELSFAKTPPTAECPALREPFRMVFISNALLNSGEAQALGSSSNVLV